MNWQIAVQSTVTGLGYDLVDAEKSAGGLLRVFIDHLPASPSAPVAGEAEQFITVDDCERVTRQLQHVLEVEGCAYERLEVSSPGLDRPLKKAADYERFVGEQVEITLKQPFQGRKRFAGVLQAHAPGWRLILTPPAPKKGAAVRTRPLAAVDAAEQALDFSLDEVREARLVVVVDFKGRRFAPETAGAAQEFHPGDEVDGGRIQ